MEITNHIKNLLAEYEWTSPALRIKSKTILSADFALLILKHEKMPLVAEELSCSRTTINTHIKKHLPELYNQSGGEVYARVLNLIEHKKCYKCNQIKHWDDMRVRQGKADFICTDCSKVAQTTPSARKKRAANEAKRRASKLERTVAWSDTERIKQFYEDCPDGYHVDHIVPLQGERVSGLHTIDNLQYLLASKNMSKSNKFNVG